MFIVAEVAALSVRLPAYCRWSPKLIVLALGVRTEWLLLHGLATGINSSVLRKFVKGLKKWRNP